jgi:hypothetical protein
MTLLKQPDANNPLFGFLPAACCIIKVADRRPRADMAWAPAPGVLKRLEDKGGSGLFVSLSLKYCLLVFLAVLGILQGAAARNNLRGLFLFGYRALSYVFAALAIGFSLFIFFNWNSRYATSVIEGSEQAGLFTLGVVGAVFCTVVVSSVIKSASFKRQAVHPHGLEALKKATIFNIIRDKTNGRH